MHCVVERFVASGERLTTEPCQNLEFVDCLSNSEFVDIFFVLRAVVHSGRLSVSDNIVDKINVQ